MGIFDRITGRRAASPAASPADAEEIRAAFLALDRPTAPFALREGREEGADLVAEWRIADAAWAQVFAKAGLLRAAQVLLRLDAAAAEVRSAERDLAVEWRAGLPVVSLPAEGFDAHAIETGSRTGYAFREEDLRFGRVHEYRFRTAELVRPLQEVAVIHGWTWRPVAPGHL